ncbi:MAG: DUF4097 domain-containing protein [Vicinamibacterales bacterium]
MTRTLSASFALAAILAVAVPAFAQRTEERVDRTFTVEPGGTLRLKTFSGRVTITGTPGNQVVIHAVRRAPADRLADIKLEITQSGSTIEVDANHRLVDRDRDNVVETDFDIQVPSRTRLDIDTFSAPVTVTGVAGNHDINGFSSGIRLADVSGALEVKTFSGDVNITASSWSDGDDVELTTFSGEIELKLPENARGNLRFNSFSGDFNSDLPVTLTSSSKRNFRGALNGGGNTGFRLKTFSGDVSIRR